MRTTRRLFIVGLVVIVWPVMEMFSDVDIRSKGVDGRWFLSAAGLFITWLGYFFWTKATQISQKDKLEHGGQVFKKTDQTNQK